MTMRLFILLVVMLAGDFHGHTQSLSTVQSLLNHAILDRHQAMEEVQRFTERRVPPCPLPVSAEQWTRTANQIRTQMLDQVVFRGEAAKWRAMPGKVIWSEIIPGGKGYQIRKLRYEAVPGLWIPALLYLPDNVVGRVPGILNVNGHDSVGKAVPYKQIRCINQAKRGMVALNVEWLGMGQLTGDGFVHYRMNQLDLCGTSGEAVYYLAMSRALDLLEALPEVDPKRLAMTGLSGGGWQTIFFSALEPRVALCNPVAGYSSFATRARYLSDLGDSEQTPSDMATVADYTHLTAMRAPRPTLLTFNHFDNCCFAAPHALGPLVDAAAPCFKILGAEGNLRSHDNFVPGTHNFEQDNREQLYKLLGDFFVKNTPVGYETEIACADELKSPESLHVDLPADNANFVSIARTLAGSLPLSPVTGVPTKSLDAWKTEHRALLQSIARVPNYSVTATLESTCEQEGLVARYWKLALGREWTVPVVELTGAGHSGKASLLISERGKKELGATALNELREGHRVFLMDPFYFGENKIAQRDYLFALLVAAVGERPLGIQAGQCAAVALWIQNQAGVKSVRLGSEGPRSSIVALVAAATEQKAIAELDMLNPLASLKEMISTVTSVEHTPELYCFGLLKYFDVPELMALVQPRPVRIQHSVAN